MKTIDIIDIKEAVKQGKLTVYVKDKVIYIRNEIDECVKIGYVQDSKCYTCKSFVQDKFGGSCNNYMCTDYGNWEPK